MAATNNCNITRKILMCAGFADLRRPLPAAGSSRHTCRGGESRFLFGVFNSLLRQALSLLFEAHRSFSMTNVGIVPQLQRSFQSEGLNGWSHLHPMQTGLSSRLPTLKMRSQETCAREKRVAKRPARGKRDLRGGISIALMNRQHTDT